MFRPILDRVLFRDISTKQNTSSLVPEMFQETNHIGEVVAVGSGVFVGSVELPMPVSAGDHIRFNPLGVEPISVNDEALSLIRVPDIYGIEIPESPELIEGETIQ